MRFSFNSRVGSAVLAGKARKGRSFRISDCGMTDRGCLPAIASPPGIARLQPRRTGRSGEAGGESRSHSLGRFGVME
jgi:hypothetical protein